MQIDNRHAHLVNTGRKSVRHPGDTKRPLDVIILPRAVT
jgi:hypothetical protein